MFDWFSTIFDVTLLATIGLIFTATLTGAYFRSTRRDPCLKSFDGFHVTLERTNGKMIWGVMELESTGLELSYRDSVLDSKHVESSYIIYAGEYGEIQAIYRYADDLNQENREKRGQDIQRSFHPGLQRRIGRSARHFINTAAESLNEVFGLILGRLRKPAGRYITEASETHLRSLGDTMIGRVGYAHDPLLEKYIGQKVVIELLERDDEVHEHVGIFKNYSPDFLEILDVLFPQHQVLDVGIEQSINSRRFQVDRRGDALCVTNRSAHPMLLLALSTEEVAQNVPQRTEEFLNMVVESGECVELTPKMLTPKTQLHVQVVRELDLIVPRTRCLLRHRADRFRPELMPEIIFDLGVVLSGNSKLLGREMRLRKQLEEAPDSAVLAANLGAVLMQRQEYGEAKRWLLQALAVRYSLPDNGRRAEMLLAELERKQNATPHAINALTADQVSWELSGDKTFINQSFAHDLARAEADRAIMTRNW